jgi:hypothetical protein
MPLGSGAPFDAFAQERRWVAWRNEPRGNKLAKVPYAPDGRKAKADDPQTWGTRAEAEARAAKLVNGQGGGVGIQLGDLGGDGHLGGLDLDSCISDDGALAPWAAEILSAIPTYTERSPSGRGLKMFFYAASEDVRPFLDRIGVRQDAWGTRRSVPGEDGRDHGPAVEAYFARRYFTVTADAWPGTPDMLATLDATMLDRLAAVIPVVKLSGPDGRNGADNSRSAVALRKGLALRRAGKTFDEMCEALRNDPETASWYSEKGIADGERELHRVWNKMAQQPAGPPWNIDLKAPYDTARLLLRVEYSADDGSPTLHRHRGGFYAWNGTAFPEIADAEIRAQIYSFLDQCVVTVTDPETGQSQDVRVRPNTRIVNDVADALRAVALLPDTVAAPAWLDDTTRHEPGELMGVRQRAAAPADSRSGAALARLLHPQCARLRLRPGRAEAGLVARLPQSIVARQCGVDRGAA